MTTSTMVERCAKAIYESRPRNKPWDILGQHKGIYLKAARAAIEAMMEPDDAAKVAGGIKLEEMLYGGDPDYTGVIFNDVGTVFNVMLRSSLKGEGE